MYSAIFKIRMATRRWVTAEGAGCLRKHKWVFRVKWWSSRTQSVLQSKYEKGKQKGSTRISEVSRNIYPLYSYGPSFHNASVKTVVREWVDSEPFSGRGFAEPLPSSNELGRFPIVKTTLPVDGRFEHIVLSCNEHQTTPSFGSNEKLNELST